MSTRPDLGRPDFGAVTLERASIWRFRWWMPQLVLFGLAACFVGYTATRDVGSSWFEVRSAQWWVLTTVLHLPFVIEAAAAMTWPAGRLSVRVLDRRELLRARPAEGSSSPERAVSPMPLRSGTA